MIYVATLLAAAVSNTHGAAEKLALQNIALVNDHIRSAAIGVFSKGQFSKHVKNLADRVEVGFRDNGQVKGFCVQSGCVEDLYTEMFSNNPNFRSGCQRVVFDSGLDPTVIHCDVAFKRQTGQSAAAKLLYKVSKRRIERIVLDEVTWRDQMPNPQPPSSSDIRNPNG